MTARRPDPAEPDTRFALVVTVLAALSFLGWQLKLRYYPGRIAVPASTESVARVPSARPLLAQLHVPPATSVGRPRVIDFRSDLGVEARAYAALWPVLERDRFELRTVRCWREADYHLCAMCSSGPPTRSGRRMLGATLVKCDAKRCYWPLDNSEYTRVGWYGEPECLVRDGEE